MSLATATANEPAITVETFKALLGRPVVFQRVFVTIGGSVTAGLMLSQAWHWSQRASDTEGWFWKTQEEWERETGMTLQEQDISRKQLTRHGLMEEKLIGIPARLHLRLDYQAIIQAISKAARSEFPSVAESATLDCSEPPILYDGSSPSSLTETAKQVRTKASDYIIPETTAEITSEGLSVLPAMYAQPEADTPALPIYTDIPPEIGEEPFVAPVITKPAETSTGIRKSTSLNSGRSYAKNVGPTLTDSHQGAYEILTTYFPNLNVSRCRKDLTDFLCNKDVHATDAALLCGWLYANARRFNSMPVTLLKQIWAEFSALAEADIAAARNWCEHPFNDEKLRSAMFAYSTWKDEHPDIVESHYGTIESASL